MKKISFLLSLLAIAFSACAKSEIESKIVSYGSDFSEADVIDVKEFYAKLDSLEGKKVRVKGMVTDVCEKRGCWLKIGGETHATEVKFKVQDGIIVFPMSAKGKKVVAEGTVVKQKLSLEQSIAYLEHEAEENKKPFDRESVKEPVTVVMLKGHGAKISDIR